MTLDEIASRFAEAARIMKMLPVTDRDRPADYRSCMPSALREGKDAWVDAVERLKALRLVLGAQEQAILSDPPPPIRQTPSLDQMRVLNECLAWNWYLLPEERIAVWGIAQDASIRSIGKKLRCSPDKVKRLRRDGLKRIRFVLAEQGTAEQTKAKRRAA